jgi:hypothetical protein
MRAGLLCIVPTLLMCSENLALAQCDDKSQQNTADEAGLKGDLGGASMCATQAEQGGLAKKLEDAAAKGEK